ncbi:MAG TPA: metalloregulator ArsR/SmtB family transcription factor [Victivallales bacterium]|nr:metalloregulator ArsR/SmtB family transcription factor [Victivallales bacterium]
MNLKASEICKILGVETRVKIVEMLKSKGPLGANQIADTLKITPAAASQHLKILKHANIVKSERKGYWIPYSINPEILSIYQKKISKVCTCDCSCNNEKENSHNLEKLDRNKLKKYKEELENKIKNIENLLHKMDKYS